MPEGLEYNPDLCRREQVSHIKNRIPLTVHRAHPLRSCLCLRVAAGLGKRCLLSENSMSHLCVFKSPQGFTIHT